MLKFATNRPIYSHISKHKGTFSVYSITIIDTVIATTTRKQKELYYMKNQDTIWTHVISPTQKYNNKLQPLFHKQAMLTNKQVASYFTFGYSYKYNRLVILNHCD